MDLLTALRRGLTRERLTGDHDLLLVAFSAGTDSTALLAALAALSAALQFRLHAAHLDHGLDPDSRRRAEAAERLSARLSVPCTVERREILDLRLQGESLEACARRVRYDFLEEIRSSIGAVRTLTAHHRRDQLETVLLRLLYGSGWMGLAGIQRRLGPLWRPLLGISPETLDRFVRDLDLEPVQDPTNFDITVPRARVRHLVLPHLLEREPNISARILGVAEAAGRARERVQSTLRTQLEIRFDDDGLILERSRLAKLPEALLPMAVALLHREAGLPYPPARAATADLRAQLSRAGRVGCDVGAGWRWESEGSYLRLAASDLPIPSFAYTLEVPGDLEVPEVSIRFRLRKEPVAAWMFESSQTMAGLSLPLVAGSKVVVRNRRPGDRIRPLGCDYSRRLKEVLIDRKVPRRQRDRLPLLVVNDRIAWVPGVTVGEAFRVGAERHVWAARLEAL